MSFTAEPKQEVMSISTFEENFRRIVAQVEALRAAMIPFRDGYSSLVFRAAHGEDVPDDEWEAIEIEMIALTKKVTRCFQILKHQQEEIAEINSEIAAKAADQIAKTFCFLSPTSGHA